LKIVVGGGDGTVASVVNYIKSGAVREWLINNPPVSVLPLGTGNDLGRCLGWGGGSEGPEYVSKYLLEVSFTLMNYNRDL
jgi:diacylglycerol kinase family enzyme